MRVSCGYLVAILWLLCRCFVDQYALDRFPILPFVEISDLNEGPCFVGLYANHLTGLQSLPSGSDVRNRQVQLHAILLDRRD